MIGIGLGIGISSSSKLTLRFKAILNCIYNLKASKLYGEVCTKNIDCKNVSAYGLVCLNNLCACSNQAYYSSYNCCEYKVILKWTIFKIYCKTIASVKTYNAKCIKSEECNSELALICVRINSSMVCDCSSSRGWNGSSCSKI